MITTLKIKYDRWHITFGYGSNGETDADSEHLLQGFSLEPPRDHDEADDAEGVHRELAPEGVHRLLERGLRGFFGLHHAEDVTEL